MTEAKPLDRHAEAVAQVSEMRDTIRDQNTRIVDLMRDVQTERDRVSLLMEERARWRTDALACRTFVVKLATILEHVHTATIGSKSILDDMALMDSSETPKGAVDDTVNTIEENLRKMRGTQSGAVMEALQTGSRTDA
jgi:hypothetical protein